MTEEDPRPGVTPDGPPATASVHPADLAYVRANIPCQWGCPARTSIPSYLEALSQGDPDLCYEINRRANLLPGVLGRVCSRPCEACCRHGDPDLGEPVAICQVKRAGADLRSGEPATETPLPDTGKTVAVVGGGPSGLAAAHSLALFGHRVTLLEAEEQLGGMLRYGIPRFRLPSMVLVEEIEAVLRLGIEVRLGVTLGGEFTVESLTESFDAAVLALGCQVPFRLGVPGEELPGVYSGLDFMVRVNGGEAIDVGKRAAIIGGGFTAMDCARMARRLGAEQVDICIRETEEDLIVTREEVHETKREGVRILSLIAVTEVLGAEHVTGLRFARTKLRRDPASGIRIPEHIADSEFEAAYDTVIVAIGQRPDREALAGGSDSAPSFIRETGASDIGRLYGSGDCVGGASTVIQAIAHGRAVAEQVDRDLMGRRARIRVVTIEPAEDTHRPRAWDFIARTDMPLLEPSERLSSAENEVERGYDADLGENEARRCYLCGLKYEVDISRCIYCRWCIDLCPRGCIHLVAEPAAWSEEGRIPERRTDQWNQIAGVVIDSARCIRCGECLRICPMQCISVSRVGLAEVLADDEGGHDVG